MNTTFILGGGQSRPYSISQGGLDGSFPSCRFLNVDADGRQPSCPAAVLRSVIRMGQSSFITRSIIERSTTLKGDMEVIVSEWSSEGAERLPGCRSAHIPHLGGGGPASSQKWN